MLKNNPISTTTKSPRHPCPRVVLSVLTEQYAEWYVSFDQNCIVDERSWTPDKDESKLWKHMLDEYSALDILDRDLYDEHFFVSEKGKIYEHRKCRLGSTGFLNISTELSTQNVIQVA